MSRGLAARSLRNPDLLRKSFIRETYCQSELGETGSSYESSELSAVTPSAAKVLFSESVRFKPVHGDCMIVVATLDSRSVASFSSAWRRCCQLPQPWSEYQEDPMLPASAYLDARAAADWHAQVELLEVANDMETPGPVPVRSRIIRLFRSTPLISVGNEIMFQVDVICPGDDMPAGGTIWTDYARLLTIPYMEVYLNHTGELPNCEIALWQSRLLDEPSDLPFFEY